MRAAPFAMAMYSRNEKIDYLRSASDNRVPHTDTGPRRGQYRKETLLARYGGDVLMPDVRHLIAECPRKNAPGQACGVYYADLREESESD